VAYTGFEPTQEELDLLVPALKPLPTGMPLLNVIGNIIAYRAGVAWTTLGHTGTSPVARQMTPYLLDRLTFLQGWTSTFTPTPNRPRSPYPASPQRKGYAVHHYCNSFL
jgi:hypothetical protein